MSSSSWCETSARSGTRTSPTSRRTRSNGTSRCSEGVGAAMKPERIVDGVHRILKGYVNAYLIEAEDGLTVVDTGMPKKLERILEAVRALGHDPHDVGTILLTHHHV